MESEKSMNVLHVKSVISTISKMSSDRLKKNFGSFCNHTSFTFSGVHCLNISKQHVEKNLKANKD